MDAGADRIEIICPCGHNFEGVLNTEEAEFVCPECGRINVLPGTNGKGSEKEEQKGKTTVQTMPPVPEIHAGDRVGPYEVTRIIGEGGMGRVYSAKDTSLQRDVAIKILSHQLLDKRDFVVRFEREARAIARLNHPSIVQIYYTGVHDGLPYYAMEMVSGGSLEDLKDGKHLSPEQAVDLLLQAAEGLSAACSDGVIHRDIKPSNLMLDRSGRLKIADFGLAKTVAIDSAITHTGTIIGTPYYMSPEQGEGRTLDERTDIYSLGASFYHLLTGTPPFEADSPIGVILKHIKEDPKPIVSLNHEIPEVLAQIIQKMMVKDPENRYGNYKDLIADLKTVRKVLDLSKSKGTKKESATKLLQLISARKGKKKRSFVVRDNSTLHSEDEIILDRCGIFRRLWTLAADYLVLSFLYWLYKEQYVIGGEDGIINANMWNALFLLISFLFFFLGDAQGGMTLGKVIFRCRVGRRNGDIIGYKRSFFRTLLFFPILLAPGAIAELRPTYEVLVKSYYKACDDLLSWMGAGNMPEILAQIFFIWLLINLVFLLVTPNRTSLHDLISGSYVFTVAPAREAVTTQIVPVSQVSSREEEKPAVAERAEEPEKAAPAETRKSQEIQAKGPPPIPKDAMPSKITGPPVEPGVTAPATHPEPKSPMLAMMLSIIPGLGQFYNGDFMKGFLIILTCWLIFPWILGIIDAYFKAKLINRNYRIMTTTMGSSTHLMP